MKHEVKVPEVSEGITTGTVIAISVAVGDPVEDDQTLLELETDKAVVAIPSPFAGTISEILIAEGDSVAVGATIMRLDGVAAGPTSSVPQDAVETATVEGLTDPPPAPSVETVPPSAAQQAGREVLPAVEQQVDLTSVRRGDRVAPAAPSVRRLARELGVNIYQVQGSGPGGRISADDVRSFVHDTMRRVTGSGLEPSEFPGLHAQRPLPDFSRFGTSTREQLSRIRELTADAMSYSWSTIPMVTQYDEAVVGPIEEFRQTFNGKATAETKLTMTAILVKVCAAALNAFPRFNSTLDLAGRELLLHRFINIGVAVDTPAGLLVPVLQQVDRKGIETIAVELNDLAARARERRVKPDELEGGTFTISNLGGIGGTAFTPIVYAPQVAILGVSRSAIQPVWNGSEFTPQLRMPLSLSYDHRVIDGAAGARFLRWICQAMENPLNLVMKG